MEGLELADDSEDNTDIQTCPDPCKCQEMIKDIEKQREERIQKVCVDNLHTCTYAIGRLKVESFQIDSSKSN